MRFVTILEFNHKENEPVLHYCQWQGNEHEFETLFRVIDLAQTDVDFGPGCHASTFNYCRELIPEAAVDAHVKLGYGSFTRMFKKHVGRFVCPPFTQKVLEPVTREYYIDGPMTDPRDC